MIAADLKPAIPGLPIYVREMINIPARYFEELPIHRLEALVETLRVAGCLAEQRPHIVDVTPAAPRLRRPRPPWLRRVK